MAISRMVGPTTAQDVLLPRHVFAEAKSNLLEAGHRVPSVRQERGGDIVWPTVCGHGPSG